MSRFLISLLLCASVSAAPNIVVILCDDLGYGDIGAYGHPVIETPNVDRMAREGQRWTSFYASSPVCNPSRVALMTGRMPARIHGGLNLWANPSSDEFTVAEMLKGKGYQTAIIGKWHLGMEEGLHPLDQGFDYYYGTPGSNDAPLKPGIKRTYWTTRDAMSTDYDIPLMKMRETLETPIYQPTITKRYGDEAADWIGKNKDAPFFLYLAHNMPHVPIFRSPEFEGHSAGGLYSDVIEELDDSVGKVIRALEKAELTSNTLVVFTSDNGPWRTYYDLGGSPGHLRDGKMTTWEGGVRVPGVFWWPGTIKPAVVRGIGASVDFLATFAALAGAKLPNDREYDSMDLSETLLKGAPSPRTEWFYFGHPSGELFAARVGRYKLHLKSWETIGHEEVGWRGYGNEQTYESPILFDLDNDISERWDIAKDHPDIVGRVQKAIERYQGSIAK